MKTNALLAFFFFLVALFASTRAYFVYDSEGRIVYSGGTYYLEPQDLTSVAIGVAIIPHPDDGCSLAVVEKLSNNGGNATKIESENDEHYYITTDTPVKISFDPLPPNPCTQCPEWLVARELDFGQDAVMVGNATEFPYPVSGRFYFIGHNPEKHQYFLFFLSDQNTTSGLVAIKTDYHGHRRLIVTAEQESVHPLVLMLVKTDGDHVASHISMVV